MKNRSAFSLPQGHVLLIFVLQTMTIGPFDLMVHVVESIMPCSCGYLSRKTPLEHQEEHGHNPLLGYMVSQRDSSPPLLGINAMIF